MFLLQDGLNQQLSVGVGGKGGGGGGAGGGALDIYKVLYM